MKRSTVRKWASRGGWFVATIVRLMSRTWRVEAGGADHLRAVRDGGHGILYCFWHGRMLELVAAHADQGVGVLVSSHPDGILAERVIEPLGYVPIRGSQRRGPVAGVREMLRYAAEGGDLALTPDAHSDPHSILPGAIRLAQLTGHALVPVAATARPRKRLGSWDQFEIPLPGARVAIRYGEPVFVPAKADARMAEAVRRDLQASLSALHAELEAEMGGRPRRVVQRPRAATSR